MLMITFLTHASFSMASTQKEIIKSSADSRVYQTFTLDNEMEVLLASDPSLTQTAVSLTVGVGQFQDPDSQPGLAHYLEHMIFMGSEHYPEPNKLLHSAAAKSHPQSNTNALKSQCNGFSSNRASPVISVSSK